MKGGNGATNGSAVTLSLEPLRGRAAETAAILTQQSHSTLLYHIILQKQASVANASITNLVPPGYDFYFLGLYYDIVEIRKFIAIPFEHYLIP